MSLTPTSWERTARALTELRSGLPFVLKFEEKRMLVAAAETISSERLQAMSALGPNHMAVTARRAEVLRAMVYDDDLARIVAPKDAALSWFRAMADPSLDLDHPMKGPFKPLRGGGAEIERAALLMCKQARLLPAVIAVEVTQSFEELVSLDLAAINSMEVELIHISKARVPIAVAEQTRVHVFGQASDYAEHYAIEIGSPSRDAPVLCRLHSACFTGDILGSLKCDCGAQLDAALKQIAQEGHGVLLYLNQEGRGIGLANKMRAYALQDRGFDTVDANHRLGFEDDERDFATGARILQKLGFSAVRLMTNNPAKIEKMNEAGVEVAERVPHHYGKTNENKSYLETKARRSGHLL